jgi:hypothetical protein
MKLKENGDKALVGREHFIYKRLGKIFRLENYEVPGG